MPTVIAHHDVDDTEHWLASPKRAEFFGTLGITNIRTFTNPQNPTQVALLLDVPDLDALIAALGSAEAAAAMKTDGVRPTPWSCSSSRDRGRRNVAEAGGVDAGSLVGTRRPGAGCRRRAALRGDPRRRRARSGCPVRGHQRRVDIPSNGNGHAVAQQRLERGERDAAVGVFRPRHWRSPGR